MKKFCLSICLVFCFVVFIFIFSYNSQTVYTSVTVASGKAVVAVFDKYENTPIDNATICVLETREYYQTQKLGSCVLTFETTKQTKPIFNNSLKEFDEYTLLIYKNGYYPHFYHNLKIQHNITRTGIIIKLEPLALETEISYTEDFDYPPQDWSETAIQYYRK